MAKSAIGQRNWDITNLFKGYRNREDPTNLAPGIMVFPSRNVLTNLSDRIGPTPGYTLFGQSYSGNINPVVGSFDLLDIPTTITERHLKTWGTHVQVLWEGYDETSTPVWNNILTGTSSPYYNFSQFWEGDVQKLWTLGVNNTNSLFAWNNAMAGYFSSTSNTLTKQGTKTWEEEGFDPYATYTQSIVFTAATATSGATMADATSGFLDANFQLGQTIVISGTTANNGTYVIAGITAGLITIANGQNFTSETDSSTLIISIPSIVINGSTYTYTGGLSTTTLTGVSGPVTATVGDMIVQKPVVYSFSYFYGLSFDTAQAITVDASQLYLGSADSNVGCLSVIDNFFNYTFGTSSALARLAGEGGQFNCDATIKGLINLDGNIFATTGQNEWCMVVFNNGQVPVGTTVVYTQSIDVQKIKTTTLQASISQGAITAVENNLVFLSFSNQSLILGKTQFQDGQQTTFYDSDVMTQLSAPVIYDFDSFDFTDATIYYDDSQKYILHSFPKSSTVMIYNSNADQSYWEAPQSWNIGKFATIHGELYAHGYLTPETYKMFTGLNNNGGAISCLALFSFQNFGYRVNEKHDSGHFLEGYMATNTTINFGWNFEQSGCGSSVMDSLVGTDTQWVCGSSGGGSWLGSSSLGKYGLGSAFFPATGNQDLPPAFNIISTKGTPKDFRQAQFFISSNGVDFDWQLVAYGMEVTVSDKINVQITR